MPSPLASAEPPAPCASCHNRVAGVRWGDLCPDCQADLRRRASPIARRISLFAALLVILYAWRANILTPASRIWVAAVTIGTYLVVRRIASQVTIEVLRGKVLSP